jgi:hypothetical protein
VEQNQPGRAVGRSIGQALGYGPVMMAAAMFGVSGQAAAQIVTNGNFSTTSGPTSTYNLSSGTSSLPDWNLSLHDGSNCLIANDTFTTACTFSAGITSGQNPGNSPDGGNFISLESTSLLSQVISLTAGQKYTISFQEAGTEPGGLSGDNATVYWIVSLGGTTLFDGTTDSLNFTGNTFGSWTTDSATFTAAAGGNQTLTFTAFANFSGGGMGVQSPLALLDGISLSSSTSTPEPATLAVFGVGLAGLAAVRRRRARLHS